MSLGDLTPPRSRPVSTPSLPEVHRSVAIPTSGSWIRRLFAFAGPAYLVSVGYMDPGNWATDLQGGARFGYQLVWVLLMSNVMAVLLQTLSARLGVVTGKDLAQACRDYYPRPLVFPLWILCEIAIVACDLAEVLGAAIGLKLLFGVPLLWGVLVTAADVLLLLGLQRLGMRRMEAFIVVLVATIGVCFGIEILLSKPEIAAILRCFVPRNELGDPSFVQRTADGGFSVLGLHGTSLVIAIGIIGATVMPHNLYLHSSLVQSRDVASSVESKRQACRMNLIDSVVALNCAFFVNAAILVLAGAVFHGSGHQDVARLEDAHQLLDPLLGSTLASVVFAVALLCSGQSSTITGTLAGQIVMEGFLRIRIRPWLRRLISRALAIVPAALVIVFRGDGAVDDLLVLSQVVLSLQLAFAVIPLVTFTSDRAKMGEFASPKWVVIAASVVAAIIVGLNAKLTLDFAIGWLETTGGAWWMWALIVVVVASVGTLLLYVSLAPFLKRAAPRLFGGGERMDLGPALPEPEVFARREPRYRRIAVALELGPADRAVIEHVWPIARSTGAELILLHVAESAAGRYLGAQSLDQESRDDRIALDALAAECRAHGVTTRAHLGHGDPKSELVRLVAEADADLLVTGSHGHRLLGDLVLGETASGVRHHVRIPVLTIPSN
jgi:manganese transport protein